MVISGVYGCLAAFGATVITQFSLQFTIIAYEQISLPLANSDTSLA